MISLLFKFSVCAIWSTHWVRYVTASEINVQCSDDERSCYFLSPTKMSWEDSVLYCKEWGADLSSIQSSEENDFLSGLYAGSEHAWIGLNDKVSQWTWEWSDGSVVDYTNWRSGEPSSNSERCVVIYLSYWSLGKWNDNTCSVDFNALCEFSTPPTIPPSPPTDEPSESPTDFPTEEPTLYPTKEPTSSPTSTPTSQPTEPWANLLSNCTKLCEDQFTWCEKNLTQGDCLTGNPHTDEYVRAVCPVSCNVCDNSTAVPVIKPPPPSPTPCLDYLPVCEDLSFNCDHVEFKVLCPFTCGTCSSEYPTSMPTSAPTELCVDSVHNLEDTVNQLENVVDYLIDYIFC